MHNSKRRYRSLGGWRINVKMMKKVFFLFIITFLIKYSGLIVVVVFLLFLFFVLYLSFLSASLCLFIYSFVFTWLVFFICLLFWLLCPLLDSPLPLPQTRLSIFNWGSFGLTFWRIIINERRITMSLTEAKCGSAITLAHTPLTLDINLCFPWRVARDGIWNEKKIVHILRKCSVNRN